MAIPNFTVTEAEMEEKRRQEAKEEYKAEQRRKARYRDGRAVGLYAERGGNADAKHRKSDRP